MTLYQFRRLSEIQQHDVIYNKAVLISARMHQMYDYYLFQAFAFYIESKIHVDETMITGIRSFSISDLPESYLDMVDISGLFENQG